MMTFVRVARRGVHNGLDVAVDSLVVAREQGSHVDDHVHLLGAVLHGVRGP